MADSIRDALTAAYDEAEKTDTTVPETDPVIETSAPTEDAKVVETTDDATSTETPPEGASGDKSTSDKGGSAPTGTPPAPEQHAPASWSNEERAAWATVPPKAREAIMRREQEMNRSLRVSATARQRVEAIDQSVAPYKPLLEKYGVSLEQVLPPLLATRAALEVGTPEQKATLVANLCADFGLDLELLDTALAGRYQGGQAPQRVAAPQLPDLSQNPQLAPIFALAAQFQAAQTEKAQQAIQAVSADPHYDEVRFTMADLIEIAKRNGKTMDLPTALELAKRAHGFAVAPPAPSVSDAARTLAAARNAAASVSGAPKPTPARKPGEGSLRDELNANFAAVKR